MIAPYYEDDLITLYHGDCLESAEWLDADVLVTDTPYGVSWQAGKLDSAADRRREAEERARNGVSSIRSDGDVKARDEVLRLWGARPAIVFGTWRVARPRGTTNRLLWYKQQTCPALRPTPWFSADEEIYVIGTGFVGKPRQNVYVSTRMMAASHGLVAEIGHPTPKPVGLMEQLIEKCPPGVIADPFAGSGSTLVAARNQGRRAIGIEIEEKYCEIAARRLSQDVLNFAVG